MREVTLLTDEDRIRLFANALADDCDHLPVVKLFTPDAGATWLLTELPPHVRACAAHHCGGSQQVPRSPKVQNVNHECDHHDEWRTPRQHGLNPSHARASAVVGRKSRPTP